MDEYDEFSKHINIFKQYPLKIKTDLMNLLRINSDNNELIQEFGNELSNNELVYFIKNNTFGLLDDIKNIINFFFIESSKDFYDTILKSDNNWNEFRFFMLDIFDLSRDSKSSDETIQMYDMFRDILNEKKGKTITYKTMYTVVMREYSPKQINNLTIIQFKSLFNLMVKLENHRTTRLYKTVSNDVEVVNWLSDDSIKRKKQLINLEDLNFDDENKAEI